MKKRGKVLVVEDNPMWSNRLKEALEEAGFHVTLKKTKTEALEILRNEQEQFHFATVDLQLDETNVDEKKFEGWEIMKQILALSAQITMPIMVLTGFPGDEENANKTKAEREYQAAFFMEKSKWVKKEFINTVVQAVERLNVRFPDDHKS